jgi:hypothetical protein
MKQESSRRTNTLAYIAASANETNDTPLSGVLPLYSAAFDRANPHQVSPPTLGYLWTKEAAYPGMTELVRANDSDAKIPKSSGSGFVVMTDAQRGAQTLRGCVAGWGAGFAYRRHDVGEALVQITGGGVTVKSNSITGGAVWEWWWKGKEFINDYDYGRQLVMAVYPETGQAIQEAGDRYGAVSVPLYARHPAPTLYVKNLAGNRQSTRAIPIEWDPDSHGGGKDHAVIYANVKIGKDLTLNWRGPDDVDRQWPVVLYESKYEGPAFAVANVEAPTAYLNPEFSTYYKYDAKTDTLSEVVAKKTKVNISGGGADGLILASGTGPDAIAMGIYKNDPNAGIVLYDDSGPSVGHYGPGFSKWGIVYRSAVSQQWSFRSWIVTDSVRNIQKDFHQLYIWGVTSRDVHTVLAK